MEEPRDESTNPEPTITPIPNGPNRVTDLTDFRNSRGEPLKASREMYLCRCGGSDSKPYCDLTHVRIGFRSDKAPDRVPDRMDHYEGRDITIHDNRGVCSHSGFCTDNSPAVFDRSREPWIDADAADARETARTIRLCPSGALSYTMGDERYKDRDRTPGISVSRDGPHYVVGGISLKAADGSVPESREHYTLCRCGASRNKPFCSGAHWDIGFKDEEN